MVEREGARERKRPRSKQFAAKKKESYEDGIKKEQGDPDGKGNNGRRRAIVEIGIAKNAQFTSVSLGKRALLLHRRVLRNFIFLQRHTHSGCLEADLSSAGGQSSP